MSTARCRAYDVFETDRERASERKTEAETETETETDRGREKETLQASHAFDVAPLSSRLSALVLIDPLGRELAAPSHQLQSVSLSRARAHDGCSDSQRYLSF